MSRRVATLVTGVVLLAVLVGVGAVLPVPYVALGPGPTIDTVGKLDGRDVITVTGKKTNARKGEILLTTVGVVDHINLLEALSGWLDSEVSVVPRDQVYPPDKTEKEQDQQNREDFVQSQNSAIAAALGYLGYPKRVVVKSVESTSPSHGVLAEGDVIDAVNGEEATNDETLLKQLTAIEPGTVVEVTYIHKGKQHTGKVTTTTAEGRDGAALGIGISYERKAPFDVSISVPDVGGPSAGLMLALGIVDLVGPSSLTSLGTIAGTGTISEDGTVGPIGGIRLKLIAAADAEAALFLVPADNCDEAMADPPEGLLLAKADSLESAVKAVQDVLAGRDPAGC